jgi:hypothetical protein
MARKKTDHGRGTAPAEGPGSSGFQIKGRRRREKNGESNLSWGGVVPRDLGSIAYWGEPDIHYLPGRATQ